MAVVIVRPDYVRISNNIFSVIEVSDVADNDDDKDFLVPARRVWEILSIRVELVTSADVANRQLAIDIEKDGGADVVLRLTAEDVQAASLTVNYNFMPGIVHHDKVGTESYETLPNKLLLVGQQQIRVYVISGAEAADDMHVHIMAQEWKRSP